MIALDANFRLRRFNKLGRDPGLGTGWAYFVADAPYEAYLSTFGAQPEVIPLSPLSIPTNDRQDELLLGSKGR